MTGKYTFPIYELDDAETASKGERKSFAIFLRKQQRAIAKLQLLCKKRSVISDVVTQLAEPKETIYKGSRHYVYMTTHYARTIEYGN